MALKILPDLTFPIMPAQCNPLMSNVVQINIIEAGWNERFQRALGIHFHIFDTYVKSGGKIDYRGLEGHRKLLQDAMTFCGSGNPIATKHGEIAAAHLSIDYSDTQIRLKQAGLPAISDEPNELLNQCVDLSNFAPQDEVRVGLFMDYIGKRSPI